MLRRVFRTIRGRMMICYTALIILVIFTLSLSYYQHTARSLEERAYESLLQLAVTNSSLLDVAIQDMDGIANRIISSQLLKDAFYAETDTPLRELFNRRELLDLLFTINGSKIDKQIHLLSISGKYVEFGSSFDVLYTNQSLALNRPWIDSCLEREGKMYVASPYICNTDREERLVFSVCRAFNRSFGATYDALVEIQLAYSDLELLVNNAVKDSNAQVFVYDNMGALICPCTESEMALDYFSSISSDEERGLVPIVDGKEHGLVAYCRSSYSGLTMVVFENSNTLLSPLKYFRSKLLAISILLVLCTAFLSLILSRQLTEPIRQIQHSISQLELCDLHLQEDDFPSHNSAYELDKLRRSYTQMVARLNLSLEEAVTARSKEIEARMKALQAQMNPHFLYNTITVISIKAEDNGDYEVAGMCECLTGMLRYVTRSWTPQVSLEQEIDYLDQYLYLMRCRYPNKFSVDMSIPKEMNTISIPKLIIQPLVENSFQHGFGLADHWELKISGTMVDNIWEISVSDNGNGFSPAMLEILRSRFDAAHGGFEEEPCDHIGLTNIFERLRFCYHDYAVFKIENLLEGGCRVTVGGLCNKWQEEA